MNGSALHFVRRHGEGSEPLAALVGRRLLVSLTRAGQQAVEKAAPNAIAISRETLAPLDPREREALIALLTKLRWIASPPD